MGLWTFRLGIQKKNREGVAVYCNLGGDGDCLGWVKEEGWKWKRCRVKPPYALALSGWGLAGLGFGRRWVYGKEIRVLAIWTKRRTREWTWVLSVVGSGRWEILWGLQLVAVGPSAMAAEGNPSGSEGGYGGKPGCLGGGKLGIALQLVGWTSIGLLNIEMGVISGTFPCPKDTLNGYTLEDERN